MLQQMRLCVCTCAGVGDFCVRGASTLIFDICFYRCAGVFVRASVVFGVGPGRGAWSASG